MSAQPVWIIVIIAVFATGGCVQHASLCCRYLDQTEPVPPALDNAVATLFNALEDRDKHRILSLMQWPDLYGTGEHLNQDIQGFLFDGESIRHFYPAARSVAEILALGNIRLRIAWQDESRVIVIFHPASVTDALLNPDFWSDRWMIDVFACELHDVDGTWRMERNVCFAETGGPFPKPCG